MKYILFLLLTSCTVSRPVPLSQYERDIEDCRKQPYPRQSYERILSSGIIGGLVGAGTGALSGTLLKDKIGKTTLLEL